MPKGTKVHKCVDYLKHKYGYGPANRNLPEVYKTKLYDR